jgi:G3E family GTPase
MAFYSRMPKPMHHIIAHNAQPAHISQVRAADVVVLNKCDLATLASMAAVEDALQQLVPGVRMLRARFGQVRVWRCCCHASCRILHLSLSA